MDDERFDGLYLNVAQTTRGIEPLLDTVFSFLRRKTDFFAGPPGSGDNGTQAAIDKALQVIQKHAALYTAEQDKKKKKETKKKAASQKKTTADSAPPASDVVEMDKEGGFDISTTNDIPKQESSSPAKASPPPPPPVETKAAETLPAETAAAQPKADDGNDDQSPPVGNGGTVDGKYVWTQTLSEVNVTIPVPDNTRGRDLNVVIAKQHLKVGLRSASGEFIINAPLTKAVICDDSFWTVEDGNRLVVNLQKLNQSEWWDSVCQGHATIDVKKIQPENSSLADLDGETRKTV